MAEELEQRAREGGKAFDRLLRTFNVRTGASTDREALLGLGVSPDMNDFVDTLLASRDAPPYVPPKNREELLALVERAHGEGAHVFDHDRAANALASMSRLPRAIAETLGAGLEQLAAEWPSTSDIVDFALAYEPPATREELFALLRRWLDDRTAGRPTVLVAIGEDLLAERQAALGTPELARIAKYLASGVPAQRTFALESLRKLVGEQG